MFLGKQQEDDDNKCQVTVSFARLISEEIFIYFIVLLNREFPIFHQGTRNLFIQTY